MAKSNYLFGILSAAAVFICGYAGRDYLVVSCQLPVVRKGLVQKEIDSPNGKQKDERPKPIAQGSAQKRHQVTGVRVEESLKLKAESRKREAEFSKQTTQSSMPITQGSKHKWYQEGVFLGAKSSFPTTNNQQLTTKKIYDSQISVREQGINTGPHVEEYLKYVNLKRGQPWCAAFICWVFGQAGIENPHSGWSPDLFKSNNVIWDRAESRKLKAKSRENYILSGNKYQDEIFLRAMYVRPTTNNQQPDSYRVTTKSQQPTTADIFGIFFPEKNRIAHAGFVDQWGETWLITVEGNTNIEGSREGDGVYRKRRLVKSVYKVARYIW